VFSRFVASITLKYSNIYFGLYIDPVFSSGTTVFQFRLDGMQSTVHVKRLSRPDAQRQELKKLRMTTIPWPHQVEGRKMLGDTTSPEHPPVAELRPVLVGCAYTFFGSPVKIGKYGYNVPGSIPFQGFFLYL
jgi:hypothetical protein